MGTRRRWKVSYRLSLLVAIPTLVVLLAGLIMWQSYSAASQETRELAHSLFSDLSRQVITRTREHLAQAPRTVRYLQELSDQGHLPTDRRDLATRLLSILHAQPDYTWVSLSGEDGSFTGAYRGSDGSFRTNMSWIVGGKTRLEEYAVLPDGSWKPFHLSDDFGYDPRVRPFYRLAAEKKKGTWSPPYVFFGQNVPGITYSAPRWDKDQRMTGVLAVDFDLNRLSELVRRIARTGEGTIFMYTPEGTLLAHPEVKIVEQEDEKAEGRLLKLTDVADPVLRAYAEASKSVDMSPGPIGRADPPVHRLSFRVDDAWYLGAGTSYRVNDEFSVVIGLAAPSATFLGPIREGLKSAFHVALLVLAGGFGLAVVFASTIARPILEVAQEMDRVGGFDLREVPEDRSIFREIDRMDRSLAAMIRSLKSFAAYVPRELVQRLVTAGTAARLEGQTKRLTILFTDVAGFTTLSEALAPNELVLRLGSYLGELATVIGRSGGTVDKFIGDGVMAFWNAPGDQPDHAALAVGAALLCQERLAAMRQSGSDLALPTRIGISTGEVVVGNIGTPERMNYTVVGDAVNVASRLEGLNKVYGTSILMTDETARGAREKFISRPVDMVGVVGKLQGVKVWEPLSPKEGPQADAQERLAGATEKALEAYLHRDIQGALGLYRGILEQHPGDPVAKLMVTRCQELLEKGIPDDWSGMTRIRHK
jgi:adenylate cyclase